MQVQGIIAEYERVKAREKCRRGRLYAARSGQVSVLGGAPYGYHYHTKQEGGGAARYVVQFAEAQVVREIFTWVGIEGCSLSQVCRRLRERGLLTRTGKCIGIGPRPACLRNRLTWDSPLQQGPLRPGPSPVRPRRGVPEFPRRHTAKAATPPEDQIPIPVPAIVEPALFEAVQERLAEHRRHPGQAAPRPRHRRRAWWCASGVVTRIAVGP